MALNDCLDTTVKTMREVWFGRGKLGKVMESYGMLKSSKSMNPV